VPLIRSAGGLPIVPAFSSVGALMLWTGPGARWAALPAMDLFRLALENDAAAVVVDGAGPDELYLQRDELKRLLEPAADVERVLSTQRLLLPLPPTDPPKSDEMVLVPGRQLGAGERRQLVLAAPVPLENGDLGLPAFTTKDALSRFCMSPCESLRLPTDFLIRSILATPTFGALVFDAAGPQRRELRRAALAELSGMAEDRFAYSWMFSGRDPPSGPSTSIAATNPAPST
jgi:SseB protein N-terminal domain